MGSGPLLGALAAALAMGSEMVLLKGCLGFALRHCGASGAKAKKLVRPKEAGRWRVSGEQWLHQFLGCQKHLSPVMGTRQLPLVEAANLCHHVRQGVLSVGFNEETALCQNHQNSSK